MRKLLSSRAELDEAAFAIPVLLLVSLALINLALVGFAAITAGNAANYGARMGSVAQSNAAGVALASAVSKLDGVMVGEYSVSVQGDGQPGGLIAVVVTYRVPNYFGGLAALFGVSLPETWSGVSQAYFRQEGW